MTTKQLGNVSREEDLLEEVTYLESKYRRLCDLFNKAEEKAKEKDFNAKFEISYQQNQIEKLELHKLKTEAQFTLLQDRLQKLQDNKDLYRVLFCITFSLLVAVLLIAAKS